MAGADGSYLHVRGEPVHHFPAITFPDRPVVDTNGAGDAYVAAFLAPTSTDASWPDAATAGTVAASWACTSPGTHTNLITAEDLAAPHPLALVQVRVMGGWRVVAVPRWNSWAGRPPSRVVVVPSGALRSRGFW